MTGAAISPCVMMAGYGSIGRRHFRNLKQLGCTRFVFYRTRHGTVADDELAEYPATTNLNEALSHRPDIAVIANPSAHHVQVALAAAAQNCDLLIEKPLASTLDGCAELQELVRSRSLVTLIGCQFRFHPLLQKLRSQLHEGRLGQVLGARAEWGEYLPDWHPWEDYRQSYSARPDLGGGVVLTLIHPLDYLYWLLGPVVETTAATRSVPSLATPAGEDWAEITLQFASGAIGQVHLDYVQRPPVHRLSVWGDAGRVEWDCHAGTLLWQNCDGQTQLDRVPEGFERNDMFLEEARHFLDCVRQRRATQIPLEDGIAVLNIALEAKQSAERRRLCG